MGKIIVTKRPSPAQQRKAELEYLAKRQASKEEYDSEGKLIAIDGVSVTEVVSKADPRKKNYQVSDRERHTGLRIKRKLL